jgi:predicted RecA/RadA family phage recombinase
MNNYIKPGRTMTFTAPAAVTSGAGVLIGSLLVVAATSAASGQPFEGVTEGVFTLPKASGAWTEGQLLYWDSAASNLATAASATARRVGCAGAAAASGDTTGQVRLHGVPSAANVA